MTLFYAIYSPRPPICTWRNTLSFIGKLTNIGGYAAGIFKSSLSATSLNLIGYVISRGVDYFSHKELQDFILEEENLTRFKLGTIQTVIPNINVGIIREEPNNPIDNVGIQNDYCTSKAGKISTTLRIAAHFCQGTSTVLNLIMAKEKNTENSGLAVGSAIMGALAMGIPYLENHYRKVNQERKKDSVIKKQALTSGFFHLISGLSNSTRERIGTDLRFQ